MLNDQGRIFNQENIKGRWKKSTENLYRRMTDTFEEHSYMEEPMILESEVKATLQVLRTSKSLRLDVTLVGLFQATETESVNILTRIYQQRLKNETMTYRLKIFNIHPTF